VRRTSESDRSEQNSQPGISGHRRLEKDWLHLERITALRDITIAITSTLDLRSVLDILAAKIFAFMPHSSGTIKLLNPETGDLEPAASWNISAEDLAMFTRKDGLCWAAFEADGPLVINNIAADPRTKDREFAIRNNLTEYLGIALRAKGQKMGVVSFHTQAHQEFNSDEIEFITMLAGHAAIAIHNAQLHEKMLQQTTALEKANHDLERHLGSLQAVYRVASSLNQSFEAERVIQGAVQEITRIFQFEATEIYVTDDRNAALELFFSYQIHAQMLHDAIVIRKGEGIVGRVWATGQPLIFEDTQADPRYAALSFTRTAAQRGYKFLAAFPIKTKSHATGVMVSAGMRSRHLAQYEILLIRSITEQIGVAFENAGLLKRLQRNFERVRALHEVSLAVNSNLDLNSILDVLFDQADHVIPHTAAEIRLINEETGILEHTACRNLAVDEWKTLRAGRGLARIIIESKAPLAVRDVRHDPRTANAEFMRKEAIASFLGVPLTVKGDVIGCFIILTREDHDFGNDETELFSALASQAAIAIHNTRLYEQVLHQTSALEQVNHNLKARSAQQGVLSLLWNLALARTDLSSLLDETVVLTAQTLKVEYAKILELLPDGNALILRAGVGWKDGLVGRATVATRDASQAAYTLRVREPVIVEDLGAETRFSSPSLLHEHGIVSGMSVVILGKDGPYGVLGAHATERRCFSTDDVIFLQSVANLLATAIERHKAEEALAEQKNLLRTIIDTEPECVKLLAADGTLLEMNQAGLTMIEADSADQVIGKCVYPIVAPEYREEFARNTEAVFRGESGSLPFKIIGLKGTHRWMETHAVPLRTQTGEILAALSVTRDITKRRLTEEALRQSEERFKIVARATNDAIWDWNLLTNKVWWNEGVTNLFRYPADQVSAAVEWWYQNVHPEDRERVICGVHAAIETGQNTWRGEYRFRCGDGSYAFVIDRGYVIRENGKPTRMIGCMTDITTRKRAQEELEGSHERLRALAAHLQAAREEERTRVAREIHDELGQALTGVKMDLAWLRKKLPKELVPLKEKTESMLGLMDQTIQSVRRISTELRPGVLDDLGLTAAIEWQIQEFQKRTGIKCQLAARLEDIGLDRPRSTALFRIFQETLTNIARHAHATKVSIKLEQKNGDVSLHVQDNGNGIPKTKLSDPRSLGILGMRERALLLGGEVAIQGTRGKGTRVTARIPVHAHD
jgi:PAS domain S-box-containing protein